MESDSGAAEAIEQLTLAPTIAELFGEEETLEIAEDLLVDTKDFLEPPPASTKNEPVSASKESKRKRVIRRLKSLSDFAHPPAKRLADRPESWSKMGTKGKP